MSSSWLLVQHLSNINKIIKHPLQSTQRIKFTCFDVSQNYIVFGATSGGLYVFNRYPVTFFKIIPCKHGSVVQVAVSPNDKNIAIASHKGLVVLIPNCFVDAEVQYQVFNEHSGNLVTALKWNLDELYCGDSKGKITVITMPNVLSKTILHAPCSSLMQLDSSIIQIDCHSVYLLISTYTRAYICNTEKEQFRQIGKKLRYSNIGACFFSTTKDSDTIVDNTTVSTKINGGLFKNAKDDDSFSHSQINDSIKIFCGRPGARLWEVKLDGSVTHTHNLKNYLKSDHTSIIKLKDKSDERLNIINVLSTEQNEMKSLNFTKVYVLKDKFIFAFNSEGFYVFNPETGAIICWCNYFKGVKEAKLVNDLIYVWNEKEEMIILAVNDLEKVITKTLFEQKYVACADLCVAYMEHALSLVETSKKIHLVSILKEKLNDATLVENLSPLFKALRDFTDRKFAEQKLTSGIVAVNNLYANKNGTLNLEKSDAENPVSDAFQSLSDKISESTKNVKEKFQILEATVKSLTSDDVNASADDHKERIVTRPPSNIKTEVKEAPVDWFKIFNQRYDLSNINSKLEMKKFDQLLILNSLDININRFEEFCTRTIQKGVSKEIVRRWCFRRFLNYLTNLKFVEELDSFNLDHEVIQFSLTAFCNLNDSSEHGCKCSYPLPSAKNKRPDYYEIGCAILKKFWNMSDDKCEVIYRRVPFMWKYVVTELNYSEDVNTLLPLLIQFGDENILRLFVQKFTYDTWDNAVQLLINLNKFKCINCDNKFETSCDIIKWTMFANVMVQSMGGPTSLNILTRYASFIPSNELDVTFYQTCIFATVVDNCRADIRCRATDLVRNLHSNEETAAEFDEMLGEFLRDKSTKKPSKCYANSIASIEKTETKCSFCDLPFEIPILKYDNKLKCNHLFHKVCLQVNKNICNICND